MLLGDRRHHRDVGSAIARSVAISPGMLVPISHDGDVGVIAEREQRERDADPVVQVAGRRVHVAAPRPARRA